MTEWKGKDYQDNYLYKADLIKAGRDRNWEKLPEMLSYLQKEDKDEIFAASIIRLLDYCYDQRKWPAIIEATKDPSPLVRASYDSAPSI